MIKVIIIKQLKCKFMLKYHTLHQVDTNCWSREEQTVMKHFETHHSHSSSGQFVVPLRKVNAPVIGESRSQAVRRFLHLEKSLSVKRLSKQFNDVINEYFDEGRAEPIPVTDLKKTPSEGFYLPMHIVQKESSTTTKV